MRTRTAAQLANLCGCELHGPDVVVGPDVCIDSRQATAGALFVALPGERVDGRDFVDAARDLGAVAAILTQPLPDHDDFAQLVTPDPAAAFTRLAAGLVDEALNHGMVSLGVTGSSGKTSTKDMLAQILGAAAATVATKSNHNNDLGVPLTACMVNDDTQFLLCEMGASLPGDLTRLIAITKPTITGILNIGQAHLGEFGSIENLAAAKAEILAGLDAEGWAVLNAEDTRVASLADTTAAQIAWFGAKQLIPENAGVSAAYSDRHPDALGRYSFTLHTVVAGQQDEFQVRLQVMGKHQVPNATAAAAFALAAGLDPQLIAQTLNTVTIRSAWRMAFTELPGGRVLINDAYNANPDSMAAALDAVSDLIGARSDAPTVVAVLGDMLELGPDAVRYHEQVGAYAAQRGVTHLYAIGEYAADLARGAQAEGIHAFVTTVEQALAQVLADDPAIVLVKASRGLGLEKLADSLQLGFGG